MPGLLRSGLIVWLVAWAAGCAHRTTASAPAAWIDQLGGRETGVYECRATRVLDRLLNEPVRCRFSVAVLGSPEPVAYCWPNGDVFVTRGLLDLLDDEELAAAIAHEVGHVMTAPPSHGIVSLRGRDSRLTAEVDADAAGAKLLTAAGLHPDAMSAMLAKVRDAVDIPSRYREQMSRRIDLLTASHGALAR